MKRHRTTLRRTLTASTGAIVVLAMVGVSAGSATASPGALKVLIVEAQCDSTVATTLRSQILAQPGVASVDFFNGKVATPSEAQLEAYDVVLAMDNCNWSDPTAIGNDLADFQDRGGAVVGATYDWQVGQTFAGRWVTAGYSPYQTGASAILGPATLGTHDASSPLLAGVSSLSSNERDAVSLSPGATEIAKWSDGASAVAFKGDAVAINSYLGDYYTGWSGDFAKIIVNAGNVLGRHALTVSKAGNVPGSVVSSSPTGISCGATCTADFGNGTTVTLTASPLGRAAFEGWSGGGCTGTAACALQLNANAAVTATFSGCVVPKLKARRLKADKRSLHAADCKLGKVKGPKRASAKVKSQKPRPGTVLAPGSKVSVKTR
jgi:hypothetical protein